MLIILVGVCGVDAAACTASGMLDSSNQFQMENGDVYQVVEDVVIETMAEPQDWGISYAVDAAVGTIWSDFITAYRRENFCSFDDAAAAALAALSDAAGVESFLGQDSPALSRANHVNIGVTDVYSHANLHGWEWELGYDNFRRFSEAKPEPRADRRRKPDPKFPMRHSPITRDKIDTLTCQWTANGVDWQNYPHGAETTRHRGAAFEGRGMEQDKRDRFLKDFLAHRNTIAAFVRSFSPDRSRAEDLLQEVSLILWNKYDSYTPGTSFVSWARAIARNKFREQRRSLARDRLVFSEEAMDAMNAAFERLETANDDAGWHDRLQACIDKLSPTSRDLVRMRYFEGNDAPRIASRLKRSVAGVTSTLWRIRSTLADCLQKAVS
jgi:RNA polymerase sigma-70 factor (ECF subfamily)